MSKSSTSRAVARQAPRVLRNCLIIRLEILSLTTVSRHTSSKLRILKFLQNCPTKKTIKKVKLRTSLPMQGTWARSRVWKIPQAVGKPMCHEWAPALEPEATTLSLHAATTNPVRPELALQNKRSHCNKKPLLTATRESLCIPSKTQHSQKQVFLRTKESKVY